MAAMMPTGLVVAVFAKATSAEPDRDRTRKMRSGISGSATLCSTKRKAASRPRARTIVASVRGEPKPDSSARVKP
jgi:Flp pilus assembly protein TadD